MEPSDIMTTAEVSALLRRPIGTLRYWRHRGEGPTSFRIGNTIVYDRAEVVRWLDEQRAATSSSKSATA